jgi:tetratricopeptide (TPR) repeat protein
MLRDSHTLAASILTMGYEAVSQGKSSINLEDVLSDRRGWIEGNLVFDNDTISQSTSKYLNYVFPAVRLALIAVGQRFNLEDSAARLLVDRKKTKDLLATHRYVFQDQIVEDEDLEDLDKAIAAFNDQLQRTPRDETLWEAYGNALVRAGRLEEAEDALNRCLSLRSCSSEIRGLALYNLACVKARQGFTADSHKLLIESDSLRPIDKKHTASDPDLESLREEAWFQELISES